MLRTEADLEFYEFQKELSNAVQFDDSAERFLVAYSLNHRKVNMTIPFVTMLQDAMKHSKIPERCINMSAIKQQQGYDRIFIRLWMFRRANLIILKRLLISLLRG